MPPKDIPEKVEFETILRACGVSPPTVLLLTKVANSMPALFRAALAVPSAAVENGKRKVENAETESAGSRLSTLNSQLLRGDLDNIVLKALQKEKEFRYNSVE